MYLFLEVRSIWIQHFCTQTLDSQVADIATQLQPTDQAYPIVIDLEILAGETDLSAIASEFCYQIHTKVFPSNLNIPTVNNAYSLKPLIHSIKHHLQTQNIVLILQNGQPYEELITFCRKLTNALQIAWITDQPIEPPLRGFPPQPNLVSILQNWLNEITSE